MEFNPHKTLMITPVADYCAKVPTAEQIAELYELEGRHTMMESVTLDDIERTYFDDMDSDPQGTMMLEAVTTSKVRLNRTMSALVKSLNQQLQGTNLQAGAAEIGRVRKTSGIAVMPAVIPLSDGQSISVMFHSPTNDPSKVSSDDSLIAFRFLLNKRDVTHVVSPDGGQDISLKQTCLSLANLAEKNADKFKASQARTEKLKNDLETYRAQATQLDEQATQLANQGDALKAKLDTNQEELNRVTSLADKQEKTNSDLRKQIEAMKVEKAAKQDTATAGGNDAAQLNKIDPKEAANQLGKVRGLIDTAADLDEQLEEAREQYDAVLTTDDHGTVLNPKKQAKFKKVMDAAQEKCNTSFQKIYDTFKRYIEAGGTSADWDALLQPNSSEADEYAFDSMLQNFDNDGLADLIAAREKKNATASNTDDTAAKYIRIVLSSVKECGPFVEKVKNTGWSVFEGEQKYVGKYLLRSQHEESSLDAIVAFDSPEEAVEWAKSHRNNVSNVKKGQQILDDINAAAMKASVLSTAKVDMTAFIDPNTTPDKQEQQKEALCHLLSDVAKSIQLYASEHNATTTSGTALAQAASFVSRAFDVNVNSLMDLVSNSNHVVNSKLQINDRIKFDGEALVNGASDRDGMLKVLESYGGEFKPPVPEGSTKRYYYGLRARPAAPGAVPKEGIIDTMTPDEFLAKYRAPGLADGSQEIRHGVIVYDHQLSAAECQEFEIKEIHDIQDLSAPAADQGAGSLDADAIEIHAFSAVKGLVKQFRDNPLPDGFYNYPDQKGDMAGPRIVGDTRVSLPSVTFAYDAIKKPSKAVFKSYGALLTPVMGGETGQELQGFQLEHGGKVIGTYIDWADAKPAVLQALGHSEEESSANDDDTAATSESTEQDKAITDAVATVERIRDTNLEPMGLDEMYEIADQMEKAANVLTELGVYAEHEGMIDSVTEGVVNRIMELTKD